MQFNDVNQTMGFPVMDKEEGEKRDFLPEFFSNFVKYDVPIYLEHNYGQKLGLTPEDYLACNQNIKFVSREEVFKKDILVVIRVPEFRWLRKMNAGTILVSMLHYETRPSLLQELKRLGIKAFSLDAIVDDDLKRMMVTYEMTAYGGVYTSFLEMDNIQRESGVIKDRPLRVTILGLGNLGFEAGKCSSSLFQEFKLNEKGIQGIRIEYLDKEMTPFTEEVEKVLRETDMLIDTTKRPDPSMVIIPNEFLSNLPEHAIILDLTADPYDLSKQVPQVKAIEGIPHGTIDEYVLPIDHDSWDRIPEVVDHNNRRLTISCNAWPSVMPKECMKEYGKKLLPFMKVLLNKNGDISLSSDDYFERALARSTIFYFEDVK